MKIIVASHNPGKIREFKQIFEPRGYEVVSVLEMGVSMDAVEETGETFAENAIIKARYIFEQTGLKAVADDSGLVIEAMPHDLGVRSARFMGEDTPYSEKHAEIFKRLENETNRNAYFHSAIAYVGPEIEEVFEGSVHGVIAHEVMGAEGFGYDPIFVPNGFEKSFGQMTKDEKNAISHRGVALEAFIEYLER